MTNQKIEGIGFHSISFEQLVKDTKLLIEDIYLREQMGTKAGVYAEKNHSLNNNIAKVIHLFEQQ